MNKFLVLLSSLAFALVDSAGWVQTDPIKPIIRTQHAQSRPVRGQL